MTTEDKGLRLPNKATYFMSDGKVVKVGDHKEVTPEPKGKKFDAGKLRYSLLPEGSVTSIVQVLEYGAVKYQPNGWQAVPDARTRYYDALMRHLSAWYAGELHDSESGLPHMSHVLCNAAFLFWLDNQGKHTESFTEEYKRRGPIERTGYNPHRFGKQTPELGEEPNE